MARNLEIRCEIPLNCDKRRIYGKISSKNPTNFIYGGKKVGGAGKLGNVLRVKGESRAEAGLCATSEGESGQKPDRVQRSPYEG